MLYFAYGSNLFLSQMRARCPSVEVVGRAWLPNHRLTFRGWNARWGGAVATIEVAEGFSVEGVVYRIREESDVIRLDASEGWPLVYRTERVRVRLDKYRRMRCWTYVKVQGEEGWPSTTYVQTIATGLREQGHDVSTLAAALARLGVVRPAKPTPVPPPAPRPVGRPAPQQPKPLQTTWWAPAPRQGVKLVGQQQSGRRSWADVG